LYVSYACPWAHRTLMVRALKGLQDAISVTAVHPTWQLTRPNIAGDAHAGWIFGNPDSTDMITNKDGHGGPFPVAFPAADGDPCISAHSVRELGVPPFDNVGRNNNRILPVL
jgi:glutathionyl-hydroquinone reductase